MFRTTVLAVLLLLMACSQGDVFAVTPPCVPVEFSERDPCEESSLGLGDVGGSEPSPLPDAPSTPSAFLGDSDSIAATHLIVRATFLPNTTRCTAGNLFRVADHQEGVLTGVGAPGYQCFIDIRPNEFYLGSGPDRMTLMIWRFEYYREPHSETFRQGMEQTWGAYLEGSEFVVFLGPSFDVSTEAWQIFGVWKVGRKEDGTVVAIHPQRDRWLAEDPAGAAQHAAALEMTLPSLSTALATAHTARVQRFEGRIGAAANLPMLQTTASGLRAYYEAVGAYDEGEPEPAQPPSSCAVGIAGDTAALLEDCNALMALKDTLRGTAELNWSPALPIAEWDGVTAENGRVTQIILLDKGLNGTVPPELGDLTGLQDLWLGTNQLTGTIPGEIANAQGMRSLLLNGNQLTGEIPPEFRAFTSMETLWLHQNQLSGSIPPELGSMTSLQKLILSSNSLTGTIPRAISTMRTLRILWLSHNELSGSIPRLFVALDNLERLHLQGNQLTGEIPRILTRIADNLEELFLRDNLLTGCIPPELKEVDRNDLDELSLPDCE